MGWIDKILRRNSELESMFDLDLIDETNHRAYLKQMALETNFNFIGRTISQSDFRIMKDGKRQFEDWHYLLNVRPNTDQTAAKFWQDFIYKLLDENEVLVILTDNNDLLIADDFDRIEYAVYPDIFRNVSVKDYTFQRTFQMDEVIYLTYNNKKLAKFLNGMFQDFGDLFSRMIEISMRNHQIRGTVDVEATGKLDEKSQSRLQEFIDKLFQSFKKNTIALVPKLKGFNYNEVSKGDGKGQSVDEITKLKKTLVDEVANILGIPAALIHGDLAEYETSLKAYIKFCIGPLIKKISDELNAKLVEKADYLKGDRIEVRGVVEKSVIENAEAVDKLVASGAYTRNEVREKFGDERSDDPELDKFVITKNYESIEGGET
ncbi:phage portal protein [Gracilibacillus dipsosauri]|uniref:Phage portal protein n=1 Tax=Gracilibacillus dipsosauri TaxID=178340 RepID=A0A317KZU9_9BACI|nr:phage portal protein [Gracilibacillus dipsosauri]PWU68310.1 phage portal protein [Gracilibacillus dipsosauri]